jgi:uncharacterized protein (TIGR03084 family)
MLQQAIDLREECDELYDFVSTLDEGFWTQETPFKGWTVWDVIAHLHLFDWVALQSLKSEESFDTVATEIIQAVVEGSDLATFARQRFAAKPPADLVETWHDCFVELTGGLGNSDPDLRLKWFGPDMGVRMFTTARQMETWAHGQDIYDLVQVERDHFDRIKNIAVMGVKTFGWTFVNRGLEVPDQVPYVRLTSPSGEIWEWNEPGAESRIDGTAIDFCRVVTQNRNVADTRLQVVGDTASQWMSIAQCFAGGAVDPPAPGERAWERR